VIRGIRPCDVVEMWPILRPMINTALARSLAPGSPEDVLDQALRGQAMLWAVGQGPQAVIVSRIQDDALYVWLVAGRDGKVWQGEVEEALDRYARESGLKKLRAVVRPGLARILKHWRTRAVTIEREL